MRLDGIEVKVTLGGDGTDAAVRALGLTGGQSWRIHFCEDVVPGALLGTPLLDRGVVLRARSKPEGRGDSTIKMRPARLSQLTGRWLAAREGETADGHDWEVEVEADWAGERRVLAVSHTVDRPPPLDGIDEEGRSAEELFTEEQAAFLRDCADVPVQLAALTVLPPVAATRWKEVRSAPTDLGVRAERWTVDHLDFLELSVVARAPAEAAARQHALTGFVLSCGLPADPQPQSKTGQVLDHLVRRAG
ncbi:hypothetical protein [Geodermatophilus sp. URMC 62]|uniref:hypothetical protein n=1 Tax=Geodermatophilus sp. URMC 62 TaxID=3423414 RepID=UPI00406C9346